MTDIPPDNVNGQNTPPFVDDDEFDQLLITNGTGLILGVSTNLYTHSAVSKFSNANEESN